MFAVMCLRFLYIVLYPRYLSKKLRQWHLHIFVFNSAISGILWGVAGVIFFVPGELEYQLIILLVIILKGAGSVSAVTVYLYAFYAYFPASILPISIMFILQGNINSMLVGAMSIGYLISLIIFGRRLNKTLLESLHLRHLNEELLNETQQQKEVALEANAAKTQFLAAASHDLRQPIHALNLYNGLLKDKFNAYKNIDRNNILFEKDVLEQIKEIISNSHKTIENLQVLLDSLLDISKLDAGAIELNVQNFNFLNIVNRLKNDYFPVLKKINQYKKLSLVWPEEPVWVLSDENLIEQVLRNLISNALLYTHQGIIELRLSNWGKNIRIEVIDTGMGIEKSKQKAIFSEFYQINHKNSSTHRHGLGLGLSIVKRIMPIINSEIHLESELGKGSRFYFEVAKGEYYEEQDQYQNSGIFDTSASHKSVLVIEDNIDVANAMRLLLEDWGYNTEVMDKLSSTLSMLTATNKKFDVIISDFQLDEDKTGIDAIKAVRQHLNQSIPALIVTGDINPEHLKTVEDSNIPVLHKPVSPLKLRSFLRHVSLSN